jgi:hypothetical protein
VTGRQTRGAVLGSLLRVAAGVELVSLTGLLVNVAAVRSAEFSSIMGPVHGLAYVVIIVGALLVPGRSTRSRLLALIPSIGGVLSNRSARESVSSARSHR